MPEIPELEAFKKYIEVNALDKTIINVESKDPSLIQKTTVATIKKTLVKHHFSSVKRKGKYLIISINDLPDKLVMHFGLTGFLVYTNKNENVPFSKVTFIFDNGMALHWCNVRKFGKIWLVKDVDNIKQLHDLGPDALDISEKEFLQILHEHQTRNIKVLLMDQSAIAGIGNEYSDEILFQAGVDPHHAVKDLSLAVQKKIYTRMIEVLKYAIAVRTKKSSLGERYFERNSGSEFKSNYLLAHRHTDMKCPNHKDEKLMIAKIGGRSAYYCPKEQK